MRLLVAVAILLGAFAGTCRGEAISPRRLVEVADIGPPVISPDGALVAFRVEQASIERGTYDAVWYVQRLEGATSPRRIADGGVPLRDSAGIAIPTAAVWSPDGRWIYYRALIEGRIDVWRAATDGSGAQPLTLDPADVREFALNADGTVLTYSIGATRDDIMAAEQAEYDNGIRIDASIPIGQGLFRSGAIEGRLATQRFSEVWFDRVSLLGDVPDRWLAIDLATGEKREVIPSEAAASLSRESLSGLPSVESAMRDPRSGRIAMLMREGGDRSLPRLAVRFPGRTVRTVECRSEACVDQAITSLSWHPSSGELLFTVTAPEDGLGQSILRWDIESGVVRPVARARGLLNGGRRVASTCGVSPAALACVAADADRPPRLERIDFETGRRQVLFEPNAALAADLAATVPARLLRWTDAQGRTFTGQLFPAPETLGPPPPLFVTYYTCTGFLRGAVGDEWPLASLAERGISALCINAPPHHPDPVVRYDEGLAAVESVVGLLASEGKIDPARVGMGGLSFGSAVTLWVAMRSKLLSAVSVTSPVVSPNYYLLSSLKGDVFLTGLREVWGLRAPEETPEQWRLLSPLFNLDRISAPVLAQMPEQEYLYPLDYMIPLLRQQRADLYVFPHEPHQKFQPRHKLAAFERNVDWFRFWLQGVEDSTASKVTQYRHWRAIRAGVGK